MSNQNKPFKGRAIYQPSGAAGEYSQWACNLFNGCTNRCDYCYNRHSMTAKLLGADEVTMKKQLTHEIKEGPHGFFVRDWHDIVREEIDQNREQIVRDGGLFLSFVSDPLLQQTYSATLDVLELCNITDNSPHTPIPVTILTKSAWWIYSVNGFNGIDLPPCYKDIFGLGPSGRLRDALIKHKHHLSLGFTLTGMDDMERHCISSTQERIEAMEWANANGIYTWASIEPVIDFDKAIKVIIQSWPYCKEYRIGLASKMGIKYNKDDIENFLKMLQILNWNNTHKIILKKSVLDKIK